MTENGGDKSGTRGRAHVGASDRQASPLAEGDRRLWRMYIKRQVRVQGVRSGGERVVRLVGRKERKPNVRWLLLLDRRRAAEFGKRCKGKGLGGDKGNKGPGG